MPTAVKENGHSAANGHSKPLHRLAEAIKHPFSSHSSNTENEDQNGLSQSALDKRRAKAEKEERFQHEHDALLEQREREDEEARRKGSEDENERWGDEEMPSGELIRLEDIAEWPQDTREQQVTFRGRIDHQRKVSPTLIFLLIRDTVHTIQCVLRQGDGVPEHMIKWASHLSVESLVEISGTLRKAPEPIKSASIQFEIEVDSMHTLALAHDIIYDNYRPPEQMQQRLAHRLLDLRHPSNHALFRIRAAIVRVYREELDKRDFLEIQTPKLQPAATESGAEVFKVNYFGRKAFLAQSPQLAKQMAISADMKRVYEVRPEFHAERTKLML